MRASGSQVDDDITLVSIDMRTGSGERVGVW